MLGHARLGASRFPTKRYARGTKGRITVHFWTLPHLTPRWGAQRKLVLTLVEDNAQEGRVDVETAIVPNEAQFPEFVHEEIDSGARCPDHFRQRLLRYLGNHLLRLVLLAIASEQQQRFDCPASLRFRERPS